MMYVLKYNMTDDNKKYCTKFPILENMLKFMVNISFCCDRDSMMTVFSRELDNDNKKIIKTLIKDYPCNILRHFKPELSEPELINYLHDNMQECTKNYQMLLDDDFN